ncbi:MAG: hypothetical protein OHK0019_12710 [Saprospiraceae bacterium]
MLFPFPFFPLFAQISVGGKISDEKNQPLVFASVALVKGALSDESGTFSIPNVLPGEYHLQVTMMEPLRVFH